MTRARDIADLIFDGTLPSQTGNAGRYLTTDGSLASWQIVNLTQYATLSSPTFTGTVVLPSTTSIGDVSSTEIGFLDGVTSAIQTQLNNKENSIPLQSTAPSSPATSDMWVDNAVPAAPILKIYNGTSWVTVAGGGGAADDDQIVLATRVFG